jgi:hypothetical protein
MPDLLFSAMTAWNQTGLFIGGLFCLGVGALLFCNSIYWRLKAERVEGAIIGVRKKDGCYFPVYRYTLASGETFEANSHVGSGLVRGKETGRAVPLLVFPDKKDEAEPANSYISEIVGLMLASPGLFLICIALTAWPVTWMSGAVLLGLAVYGWIKFRPYIIPKERCLGPAQWQAERRARNRAERARLPVQRIEDILASPEGLKAAEEQRKASRIVAPVLLLFGLGLVAGGVHTGNAAFDLKKNGLRAAGSVTGIESRQDSAGRGSGTTYYPVVKFLARDGKPVRFHDRMGANPPLYRAGEAVEVLYLEGNPERSAVIDRGVWNLLLPLLLCAGGLGMVIGAGATGRRLLKK